MTETLTSARLQAALEWLPPSAHSWAQRSPCLLVALTEAEANKDMRLDGTALTQKLSVALTARLTQRRPDGTHTLLVLVPSFEAWCFADLVVRQLTSHQPWRVVSSPMMRFDATYWQKALETMPDILVIMPRMLEQALALHYVDKSRLSDWLIVDSDWMAHSNEKASLNMLALSAPAQRQTWLLSRGDSVKPSQALSELVHTPILCKTSDVAEDHAVQARFVAMDEAHAVEALMLEPGRSVLLCEGPQAMKHWQALAEQTQRPVFKISNQQTESAQEKALEKWLASDHGMLLMTPAHWARVSERGVEHLILTFVPEGYDVFWHFYRARVQDHGSLIVLMDDPTQFIPMVEALGMRFSVENLTADPNTLTELGSDMRRTRLSIKAGYVPKVAEPEPEPESPSRAHLREREDHGGSILDGREVRSRKKGKKGNLSKKGRLQKGDHALEERQPGKKARRRPDDKAKAIKDKRPRRLAKPKLDEVPAPLETQEGTPVAEEATTTKTRKPSRLRTPRHLRQQRRQGFKKPEATPEVQATSHATEPTTTGEHEAKPEGTSEPNTPKKTSRRIPRGKTPHGRRQEPKANTQAKKKKPLQPISHQSTWDGQLSSHLSSWEQGQAKHRRQDAHQWRDTPSSWDAPTSLSLPQSTPGLFGDHPHQSKGKGKGHGGGKPKSRFMRRARKPQ